MNVKNKDPDEGRAHIKTIANYCNVVKQGLFSRWKLFNLDLLNEEFFEVVGGLLSRQANLSLQLARNQSIWNPDIAPLIYRTQIDCYINLAWILEKNCTERAQKFVLYGLGQEKLQIEHLKEELDSQQTNISDADERTELFINARKNWLNEQLHDFLTEIDLGNWSGLTIRKMAEEANCIDLYNYAYSPFSTAIHNMWPHLARHDLKKCKNPLHKKHRIPLIDKRSSPNFEDLIISAKYIQKTYSLVDKKLRIMCKVPLPYEYLLRCLDYLH